MTASRNGILTTAEHILSATFGGQLRLEVAEGLGGSHRSNVFRCAALEAPAEAPATVVVKHAVAGRNETYDPKALRGPACRLFNEWAGLRFLSEIANDASPAPRFYGGNRQAGVIVIEDLGNGHRLDHLLLGDDAAMATTGLIEWAQALGRLHALTVGQRSIYDTLRNALGPREKATSITERHRRLLDCLKQACDVVGVKPHRGCQQDLPTVAAALAAPGAFDAYTHGDPCPDNTLYAGNALRLLDFESGNFRHALLDGVYGRIHFPTCWCVNRLPDAILRQMETAYRRELVTGCPEAEDDTRFYGAVVATCTDWTLETFAWGLSRLLEQDASWGMATGRQRGIVRFEILAQTAEAFGHLEAVGATAGAIAAKLRTLWPDVEDMPDYPAFTP